jgi:hypothetical protein
MQWLNWDVGYLYVSAIRRSLSKKKTSNTESLNVGFFLSFIRSFFNREKRPNSWTRPWMFLW